MTSTPRLGLPFVEAAQAQKHVTHNQALEILDALVEATVAGRASGTPPTDPAEGDTRIVGASPTGAWVDRADALAAFVDGAWLFAAPAVGWQVWVVDEHRPVVWTGSAWKPTHEVIATFAGLAGVGVGTAPDATNRLAVRSPSALFAAEATASGGSGDVRLIASKESAARTASLLLQSGFSGRAEIGLSGDDDLHVKVSADGAAWTEAIRFAAATGRPTLAVDLPISEGGTGASTRAKARWNLGFRPNLPKRNRVTGAAWLASVTPADNGWYGICWAAELGLFCAVAVSGTGNRVMTSPDGITWTARASAVDNNWLDVCWSAELGLFVAVASTGTGNRVMTSPDSVTWTARASAADNLWIDVCWSPERGLFCAVAASGTGNRVMTSPDGISWTTRASAADNNWAGVCWSADLGLFVAVAETGAGNRVMTSPDGIVWTARASAADNGWHDVCWSPELGVFVAVATTGTGNRVMTSPDGVAWTTRASAVDNNWQDVCWAAEIGLFVAAGVTGIMTSPDGITWTVRTPAAGYVWTALAWSAELGLFASVAATGTGNRAMTSVSAHSLTYRS